MHTIINIERLENKKIDKSKETNKDRFARLSTKRLESACDDIRLIENLLQNPYTYEYDYKDIEYIVRTLEASVNRLKAYHRLPTNQRLIQN